MKSKLFALLMLLFVCNEVSSESWIGMWSFTESDEAVIAMTKDGNDVLTIQKEKSTGRLGIAFFFKDFDGFEENLFSYRSEKYGEIETDKYKVNGEIVIISDPQQVHLFISALKEKKIYYEEVKSDPKKRRANRTYNVPYIYKKANDVRRYGLGQFSILDIENVLNKLESE